MPLKPVPAFAIPELIMRILHLPKFRIFLFHMTGTDGVEEVVLTPVVIADLSNVILGVYDVKGQLITELLSKIHTPGKYEFIWDADYLATGMYFLEMKVYSINGQLIFKDLNKMLYLK